MGMFSWKCKGCGRELVEGERVRMDGCVGEYDGYGRAGNFSYEGGGEPAAWHKRCYDKASKDQKLDETPSEHAPNQGFGYRCLEFMKGYDPQKPTTFDVKIYVGRRTDTPGGELPYETTQDDYHLTARGLQSPREWEEKLRELENNNEEITAAEVVAKIGNDPNGSALEFTAFELALKAAMEAVVNFGECDYEISIWGTQKVEIEPNSYGLDNICGIVFEREHNEIIKREEETVIGSDGQEHVRLKGVRTYTFETKDEYSNSELCQFTHDFIV
jgi:hypothetical protein